MPTLRELEEALANQPPDEGEQEQEPRSLSRLSPDAMLYSFERDTAPLAIRDTLRAVLAEARATTRLARWTLAVATLALFCAAAGIAVTLLA
jgi:hypothetical protein